MRLACMIFLFCIAAALAAAAQTFTVLYDYNQTQLYPNGFVQGVDGNLYGTTQGYVETGFGGCGSAPPAPPCGTVYKITAKGVTTLHTFDYGTDGAIVQPLVQGTDGYFYGTTQNGGTGSGCTLNFGCGTVFQITPQGTFTTLHNFSYFVDGAYPGPLVRGVDGNFYGTTFGGNNFNDGSFYKITPEGTLTTVLVFPSNGISPVSSHLVPGTDGNFYGTSGSYYSGIIFKMTPTGTLTVLYNFCNNGSPCPNGDNPGVLVLGADGNFYGVCSTGGDSNNDGTLFQITRTGAFTLLHTFDSADGRSPAALVQGSDGNFYGTAMQGGSNGDGTIFKITPTGTFTKLIDLDNAEGLYPETMLQYTSGLFNGATQADAANGFGSFYSLSVGLKSFVETVPTMGKASSNVIILGNNLKSATTVTFDGTSAKFKVLSSTAIVAVVPSGAKSGIVEVISTGRTLKSNTVFRVLP